MATKYPLSLVIRAVDQATKGLRQFKQRASKLFQPIRVPLLRLGNRLSALAQEAGLPRLLEGFRGVGSALANVKDKVFELGKRLLAMGGVAAAVFFGITRSAVDAGDELAEMADRLGLTVDGFAQLRFAAAQADVPAESFNDAMDTLSKRLGEAKAGGGQLLSFLQKVSPTLARQVRAASGTEEAFNLLVGAFEKLPDPARRAALGAAVFGRGAKQMGEFAGLGREAIDAYRKRFTEVAGSQERFARGAGDLDNAMRETQVAFLGLRNAAAAELFPALTEVAKVVTGLLASNRAGLAAWAKAAAGAITGWVRGGGVQRLADGLRRVWEVGQRLFDSLGGWPTALAAVAAVMAGPLLGAIGGLISAVVTLGAAIGFTPVGWILAGLAAIAAVAVLIWKNFDKIKAVLAPAFAPALPALRELGVQLKRLWGILAPVLLPALKLFGAYLGGRFVQLIQHLGRGFTFWVEVLGKVVGLLVDLAGWAGTAGAAIAEAFTTAWEKVKPIADVLEKLQNLPLAGMQAGMALGQRVGGWLGGAAGGAAVPPPLASSTEARVEVSFANLPSGARVTADPRSTAPLDLSLGYSMVTP